MNAALHNVSNEAPRTLVYGLGTTGLSAARYLARTGVQATYYDSRENPPGRDDIAAIDPDAELILGTLPDERIAEFERVVVSPGIPATDELLGRLAERGISIQSDVELFVAAASAGFVAVTGSNGKSTVTTLIANLCEAAGLSALAGGNLGRAALDLLEPPAPDLYVLELSSFQLQRTAHLPARVAVLLNISPDHLDWHRDYEEYRAAKYRVFEQCEAAVVNRADETALARLPAGIPSISFGLDAPDSGHYGIRRKDGTDWLARGEDCLLNTDELAVVGRHNQANALAALAAVELLGVEAREALKALAGFTGLPHRMQFVAECDGVRYINDSKATNVGAAIASVESLDCPVVLLAGGQGKGGDFDALARSVAGRLRALVVFGEDAPSIARAFDGRTAIEQRSDLEGALASARRLAKAGDAVLLAPACASFDQFENFKRRGDTFAALVREMGA